LRRRFSRKAISGFARTIYLVFLLAGRAATFGADFVLDFALDFAFDTGDFAMRRGAQS
jgi:hypothetical protein